MRPLLLASVALAACKREPDADFTKRKLVEQTVAVTSIGPAVKLRVKLPDGVKSTVTPSYFEPENGALGPKINFHVRLETNAPKTPEEALKFDDQREVSFKSRALDDGGFIVTNTPTGDDANYYTIAIRHFPSLSKTAAPPGFVVECRVDYLGARNLRHEKEVVRWMESICTDLDVTP
jgi:hypothetical protein